MPEVRPVLVHQDGGWSDLLSVFLVESNANSTLAQKVPSKTKGYERSAG